MKSTIFSDDGSDRSNLFFELYEYKIRDDYFFPEEAKRKIKKIRKDEINLSRSGDEYFSEFESYIKKQFSDISDPEGYGYEFASITYISPFLYSFYKIIFYDEEETNSIQELKELFNMLYEKKVVQDFIYVLNNYDPYLFHIISDFDLAREIVAFKEGGDFYLDEYEKDIIEKVVEFTILQYELEPPVYNCHHFRL